MSPLDGRFTQFKVRNYIAVSLMMLMVISITPPAVAALALQDGEEKLKAVAQNAWTRFDAVATALTPNRTKQRNGIRPSSQSTKAEREGRVVTLEVNPANEVTLRSREPLSFTAIPLDHEGQTIHGLRPVWHSSNKRVIFIKQNGEAVAGNPGQATITARIGNKRTAVQVVVVEGAKEAFGGKKKVDSTRTSLAAASNTNGLVAQKTRPNRKRAHAIGKLAGTGSVLPFIRDPSDDPLPDNETSSLYQPDNLIGTPPGKKKPGALTAASAVPVTESGNKNFSFGLPIVGLPGRGIDLSLQLVYNSLLWHKSTNPSNGQTWMTYDVDSGYPAQGFRLGFGQIEDQGSAGFTLVDSDGTRHALVFSNTNNYDTTDGTFIHFTGGSGWGTLFYPDGTQVTYGAAGGGFRSYPTVIKDRNGNYISISYVNNVGPRIYSITDTVGRLVRFYYDSNSELIAITTPGLTGQSDLQVMRFYYETLSLPSGLFASGINVDKPASARVIRYIYLPASAEGSSSSSGDIGYRFDYSPYGMIYHLVKFQGMTASTTSTSSSGTVTESSNTTAATTTYGYPTTANALSDLPTFGTRTDNWAGRTGGGSAPFSTFAVSEGTNETTSTVTAPDNNTVTVTLSVKNAGAWNDGLVTETRVQNSSSAVFSKTVVTWEQNPGNGTPRIASVKMTNEEGKTRAIVLTYDSTTPYNNVSVKSEREFTSDGTISSTELRRTETTYVMSSNYLNRRLLRLPSMVKVFPGGSSVAASRIDYAYDDYGTSHANLTARNDIIMHDVAFDPFQEPQETWDWVCTEWGYNESGLFTCLNWEWQLVYFYYPYDWTTDYRGNVTSVTTYPDATTTSNPITHASTYDIAGNIMTSQVDCCQLQTLTYSSANDDYAYPRRRGGSRQVACLGGELGHRSASPRRAQRSIQPSAKDETIASTR
jgi:YD repeat-containing protein